MIALESLVLCQILYYANTAGLSLEFDEFRQSWCILNGGHAVSLSPSPKHMA